MIEAEGTSTKVSVTDANIRYQLGSDHSELTPHSYSDSWNLDISKTLESSSSIISIYAYNTNGAHLTSMSIPLSASGEKGDAGEGSTGQTFKGSPLRMSREING